MNRRKTSNYGHVRIKEDRKCCKCGRVINAGTVCLSVNPRTKGRVWYCNFCEDKRNKRKAIRENIEETKAMMDCVSFGDEGAYLAYWDCLAELEEEYDELM